MDLSPLCSDDTRSYDPNRESSIADDQLRYDNPKKLRILVVDDDEQVRDVSTRFLRGLGYEVRAPEGKGEKLEELALREHKTFEPDVVLLDRYIGTTYTTRRGGLLDQLRENETTSKIMLFSGGDSQSLAKADERYDGFIPKPFDIEIVEAYLLAVLAQDNYIQRAG